jgi:hypothetical protein
MEENELLGKQPRRKFMTRFLTTVGGGIAALWFSKKARAVEENPATPDAGPILYHRTEEAERYYRTLYR